MVCGGGVERCVPLLCHPLISTRDVKPYGRMGKKKLAAWSEREESLSAALSWGGGGSYVRSVAEEGERGYDTELDMTMTRRGEGDVIVNAERDEEEPLSASRATSRCLYVFVSTGLLRLTSAVVTAR